MLIDQLGRTLRAISEAHVARGETETAKALLRIVSKELPLLHEHFEEISLRELAARAQTPNFMRRVLDLEGYPIGGHHVAHRHGRDSSPTAASDADLSAHTNSFDAAQPG